MMRKIDGARCRTVFKSVLTQLWCNPERCLTAPIFMSARHVVIKRWPGRYPRRTTHRTDDLAESLGLSCVRGANLEDSSLATGMPTIPATEVQPEDHRNALDRKVLHKTPVLAMARARTCHRSRMFIKVASEPI